MRELVTAFNALPAEKQEEVNTLLQGVPRKIIEHKEAKKEKKEKKAERKLEN